MLILVTLWMLLFPKHLVLVEFELQNSYKPADGSIDVVIYAVSPATAATHNIQISALFDSSSTA